MSINENSWTDPEMANILRVSRPSTGWIQMPLGRKRGPKEVIDPSKFLSESIARFRLIEQIDRAVETLYVFDMDSTLIHSPEPDPGKEQWERHTGKKWPHGQRWWSVSDTLKSPFKPERVQATKRVLKKAQTDPKGKVVVMTGRLATKEFKQVIPKLLKKLGVGEFKFGEDLFLKRTNEPSTLEWKKKMISGFARRYPNLKKIYMWDDRADHVLAFERHIKELNIPGKVTHVDEKPTVAEASALIEVPTAVGAPKPMRNKLAGNLSTRLTVAAAGTRWQQRKIRKEGPSLLGKMTSYTRGKADAGRELN